MPSSGSNCLVVGGGLIGSNVAKELAGRGCSVTVLSRSFGPLLDDATDHGIRLASGEVPGSDELEPLVAAADTVFFLAGSSTPALADAEAASSIPLLIMPLLSVLDAMRRTGTSRIAIASSGGSVYGNPRRLPTPEDTRPEPISVHGLNALVGEEYAALYRREHGLEPVILRFSNVYGPAQPARAGFGVIASWCEAHSRDEPLTLMGDAATRRDFLHAADAARAAALASDVPGAATFNVGSGESTSLKDLVDLIGRASGTAPRVHRLPGRPMDVAATQLDSTLLREATGWQPQVQLADGIAECWRWASHRESSTSVAATRSP